jgi:HTH-type transcriptional regulator / antitoxin HigA
MIALIRSEAHYREVLERVALLAEADPPADSSAGKELGVLALLLQDYERRTYPLAPRSPLAALRLRMDQLNLAPKDLIPYLGSRSRVSEVLSGKRPLSLAMIRALHSGLGVPLESLVSEEVEQGSTESIEWDRFPVKEMIRRGWVTAHLPSSSRISFERARDIMLSFLAPIGGPESVAAVLHKTDLVRTARASDRYALAAWSAYVLRQAEAMESAAEFEIHDWRFDRLRELRTLSRYEVGPRLALQFLAERGIVVVVAPHLPRTRLDGGAMLRADGTPVIGLTLRHDRVDNFWFTLFHELMHVLHHLKSDRANILGYSRYLDDLDVAPDLSPLEKEADAEAREALVPAAEWEQSAARFVIAPATVVQLARSVGVADAVVAGRVRFERRNYRLLSSMLGAGDVRSLFPQIKWPTEAQ